MKFFCITNKNNSTSVLLLKKACEERSVEFVTIDINSYDFSESFNIDGNILYRVTTGAKAKEIERNLVQNDTITFYNTYKRVFMESQDTAIFEKNKLSVPKTIPDLPNNEKLLKKYADHLGGFPLVVKVLGKSHGIGVHKVNSFSELTSLSDKLNAKKDNSKIVMKKFIDIDHHARLIVLGDRVIGSIEYIAKDGEFRTNIGEPLVESRKFSVDVEKTAVEAVKMLDLEFGGVDILVDHDDNHYVAEVNFPCFFPRCQLVTKDDISGMMVDYLVSKAEKNNNER